MSRQRKIPTPSWEQHTGLPGGMSTSRARFYALLGVIAIVIVAFGIIGAGFLLDWIDERQLPGSTAIKVDEEEYTVKEFTERVRLFTAETGNTQSTLVIPTVSGDTIDEAILLRFAGDEGVEATEEEINAEIAELLGITVDDPSFDSIYQQEVDNLDMTEEEYRNYAEGRVLDEKMAMKFEEELPEAVESVNYRQIQVSDQALADDIKRQLDEGADFAALAAEYSTDTTTKDSGGDKGWLPRGILREAEEDVLFSLEVNAYAVYPAPGGQVYVYQVIEKSDSQPVPEEYKATLATTAYTDWKTEKQEEVEVVDELNFTDGDPDKINYVIDNADLTSGL